MSSSGDFLFRGDLSALDPDVARLIALEQERQCRKLILIPSESSIPWAVREASASVLMNIYAEGYPHPGLRALSEDDLVDYERSLAHYRRYGDRRYYRGVEYANIIEMLACRRCAELFATADVSADQIHVNVQPLSGAPANAAVMLAALEPGDTFMAMALSHGGHLSHGNPINISGRLFRVVPYHVEERTERLDYDAIEELALQHRPKLIVAGYTSYPYQPDWARFRQIADRVGAYLMADIAHVAGMVVAGAYASPVGHAHVITFTTHKTLCGPRAACILTTEPALARKIDRAVFPGLQGGPHVNVFAAMAVAFRLARTEQFRRLQHQIVANAKALAQALADEGMRIPCGGTDTHLLLLDCRAAQPESQTPLLGHVAASVLELAGLVVNKQTIPGDRSAYYPSGIRLGTPWVTQRGLQEEDMACIASVIARTLREIEPFAYESVRGPVYRGKIGFDALEELRAQVAEIAARAGIDVDLPDRRETTAQERVGSKRHGARLELVEVRGELAAPFMDLLTPTPIADLEGEEWRAVTLLERDGRVMSHALLRCPDRAVGCYWLAVPPGRLRRVVAWLRALSDGYIRFDDADVWAKLPGPVVVRELGPADDTVPDLAVSDDAVSAPLRTCKPYFIGLRALGGTGPSGAVLPLFTWQEPEEQPVRRTPLFDWHARRGARLTSFAGWEMPLWYTSIGEEHHAVREAAGLFDAGHMGILEARGPHAASFLDLVTTNDVYALRPGESQYTYLLSPDGRVIDDLMIYRIAPQRYLMVVNAANAEKDWAWLQAVNGRAVRIDEQQPWAQTCFQADLCNRHDPARPDDGLVVLALQGPRSREILLGLFPASGEGAEARSRLMALRRTQVMEVRLPSRRAPGGAYELIVARTGYTGEPVAFEIFVHPGAAEALWEQLIEIGEPLGLQPAGLGARDSLRIEAGLPLYGHELAGPLDLRPDDAGFGGYVKLHKPFFIGRQAYIAHMQQRAMAVVRFRVGRKGVRVPRLLDVVVDSYGRVIGQVTSCSMGSEGYLVGQACIELRHAREGENINIFPHPTREDWEKPYDQLELGDRLVLHCEATVVERFLRRER